MLHFINDFTLGFTPVVSNPQSTYAALDHAPDPAAAHVLHITNGEDSLIVLYGADQSCAHHISMIWSPIDSPQYVFNATERGDRKLPLDIRWAQTAAKIVAVANVQIEKWLSSDGRYD